MSIPSVNSYLHKKKCVRLERETGERVDRMLRELVPRIKERLQKTDDNCTIVCFGSTGSGKSSMGFHTGNIYNDGVGVDIDYIGFDAKSWADAMSFAKNSPGCFLMHDEGNFSKRDSMSQQNKDFIDLLFAVRSKNWFMWINNPSADYLDKALVLDDLVNFFVFIHAKQRRYYFFTRKQLLKLYHRHKDLRAETIKNYGKYYASYDGWFLKYDGSEWIPYLEKKDQRVDDKIDSYIEKYGVGKTYTLSKAAQSVGVSVPTMRKYIDRHQDDAGMTGCTKIAGIWRLTAENVDYLRGVIG